MPRYVYGPRIDAIPAKLRSQPEPPAAKPAPPVSASFDAVSHSVVVEVAAYDTETYATPTQVLVAWVTPGGVVPEDASVLIEDAGVLRDARTPTSFGGHDTLIFGIPAQYEDTTCGAQVILELPD